MTEDAPSYDYGDKKESSIELTEDNAEEVLKQLEKMS
jgi:hypothetical protein